MRHQHSSILTSTLNIEPEDEARLWELFLPIHPSPIILDFKFNTNNFDWRNFGDFRFQIQSKQIRVWSF